MCKVHCMLQIIILIICKYINKLVFTGDKKFIFICPFAYYLHLVMWQWSVNRWNPGKLKCLIGTLSLQSVGSVCTIRWYANIPYKIWEHFYTSKFHIFSNKHPKFLFHRCLCSVWGVFFRHIWQPHSFSSYVLNTQTSKLENLILL